jgi:hypothetical protein
MHINVFNPPMDARQFVVISDKLAKDLKDNEQKQKRGNSPKGLVNMTGRR